MLQRINKFTSIGAAVGFFFYLLLGLLPAALYGGYAGALLANGIFGNSGPGFLGQFLILMSLALAVIGVAGLFIVGGAAAGAAVYKLTQGGQNDG